MSRLPRLTGKEIITALGKIGFSIVRIKGSHHILINPDGRRTVVPVHSGEIIGSGLLIQILRDCQIAKSDFEKNIVRWGDMTQTITPPLTLYDCDLDLWLETAIAQLRVGDYHNLDVENLIEELEGLSGSNKREIETRLERLIEHILKRCHVDMPECYRGWLLTIFDQRRDINKLLRQSPSLKRHFLKMFDDCFETSLKRIKIEYPDYQFPDTWQFGRDIDTMLNANFWE